MTPFTAFMTVLTGTALFRRRNNLLAGIDWLGFATMLVIMAVAWGSNTEKVSATDRKVDAQQIEIAEVKKSVNAIKTDVAVIRVNQENLKEKMAVQAQSQEETNRLLRQLLSEGRQ